MAKTTDWGLTDAGFRRPTYAELLDALEYKARELFGTKANLTVRSPLGIFLRIYAWMLNLLFSTLEDVYNSRFIDTAVGSSLYNLGRAIGLRLLGAQKAVGYLTFTGDEGVTVPEGYLAETVAGEQYIVLQSGVIQDGSVTLPATAVIAGPAGNTDANTVTVITNPKTGITTVNNTSSFEGGRNTETDAEFRERYYLSVDYAGGVNADAIRSEILQNVEGVHAAVVYENDTDETDADGLLPHSIEAIVYGGLDEDIAKQIYRRKAAGIQTCGGKSVTVLSDSGATYTIKFSRPALVSVWVKITGLIADSDKFPEDGKTLIRDAVIDYIGSDANGGTTIGEDIYYNRLPAVIYSVPGVLDFELEISSDGSSYGYENIVVGSREKAATDESKVTVA